MYFILIFLGIKSVFKRETAVIRKKSPKSVLYREMLTMWQVCVGESKTKILIGEDDALSPKQTVTQRALEQLILARRWNCEVDGNI